jgi:ABC-2 type transport system ATP-binding protein
VPAPLNPPTPRTGTPLTPLAPLHAVHGIELRGVDKTYKTPTGPVAAVRSVDLVVDAGETVALLGPNGAGKSTTIDLLLGLQQPDGGTVSVFGSTPANAIADGRIGAMLQIGAMLRELTVRELVTMMSALQPRPLPVDETLELAQLREIEHRRTEKLSGGQTQRLRFALALAGDPDLLVLDEPTVGLDVETRHAFWTTVRSTAAQGKTIVFATHYLDEADRYADRAVLMAHGRVVADGPTTEIKARVGTRTIQATLPDIPTERLETLPGVTTAERHGEAIALTSADSDTTIRMLLDRYPQIRDIEIRSAGLEQAFLQLTGEEAIAA